MSKAHEDVVDEVEEFEIPDKIKLLMQNRHELMNRIQHITEIVGSQRNMINQGATIICEMEDSDKQYTRIYRDYILPIKDNKEAVKELNEFLDELGKNKELHINQLKSMQKQHDGISEQIDIEMAKIKEKPETSLEEVKAKLKNKRRRN